MWESDIYWNKEYIKQQIRAMRELVNLPFLQKGDDWSVTNIAHTSDWSEQLKNMWFKRNHQTGLYKKVFIKKEILYKNCLVCSENFSTKTVKQKYCSHKCANLAVQNVNKPTKEILEKEIQEYSWTELGKKYNISDNAVKKWARGMGIPIPVRRGYWQKLHSKKNLKLL